MTSQDPLLSNFSAFLLFFGGSITFPLTFILQIYIWQCTQLGRRLMKHYGFGKKEVSDISNKVVSAFQAILCGVSGLFICQASYHNVTQANHPLTEIYSWFGIPYFIYDTFSMFYVHCISLKKDKVYTTTKNGAISTSLLSNSQNGNTLINGNGNTIYTNKINLWKELGRFTMKNLLIVFHHIGLAPAGFYLIMFTRERNKYDFFCGIIYMMELSTPFVCFRSILSKLKLKSSLLYLINGILMLVSFPLFRIISAIWATFIYSRQTDQGVIEAFMGIDTFWKIVMFGAYAPQVYWLILMWIGLFKIYFNWKNKKSTSILTEKGISPLDISSSSSSCSSSSSTEMLVTGKEEFLINSNHSVDKIYPKGSKKID